MNRPILISTLIAAWVSHAAAADSGMARMAHDEHMHHGKTVPALPDARRDNLLLPNPERPRPVGTDASGPGMRMTHGDEHLHGAALNHQVLFEQLEYVETDAADGIAWDAEAWFGGDFDKLLVRSEGEKLGGESDGRVEAMWSHAFSPYWDWQLGAAEDFGSDPDRHWLAFGVSGTAPYWVETELTGYVGPHGRSALRAEVEREYAITQRLILTPKFEVNAYGKDDASRELGAGVSDASFGIRLRYELNRQFAPYLGVEWTRRFGDTADFAAAEGESRTERALVAGIRLWF